MTNVAYKIVTDEFAGVTVTEPTDRRRLPADIQAGVDEYVANVRRDPTCVCEQIGDLEAEGLLFGLPALRCPIHG